MANYRYQAIDETGKVRRGTVNALNETEMEAGVNRQGLTLISSKQIKVSNRRKQFGLGKINPRFLVEFYRRFAQTLEMGIPILSGLEENVKMIPSKPLKKVIEEIKTSLEEGKALHTAMSQFPKVFSKLDLGLIKMGEQSAVLPQCMKELADFIEWKEDIRSTIKRATIYPCFTLLSVAGVIGVWIGYVLPQMATMLLDMGVELPTVTKVVMTTSMFIQAHGLLMISGLSMALALVYIFQKTKKGGKLFDKYFLKLPIIGPISNNIAIARLSHNFATMHRAGIIISSIFGILTNNVLGNRYLEDKLKIAFQELESGKTLASSFEIAGGFPPFVLGGIRHGEMTGNLDDSFKRMGDYYDAEVKRNVQSMISAFEPMILVLLGGVFGIVLFSILTPLYGVLGDIGRAY